MLADLVGAGAAEVVRRVANAAISPGYGVGHNLGALATYRIPDRRHNLTLPIVTVWREGFAGQFSMFSNQRVPRVLLREGIQR